MTDSMGERARETAVERLEPDPWCAEVDAEYFEGLFHEFERCDHVHRNNVRRFTELVLELLEFPDDYALQRSRLNPSISKLVDRVEWAAHRRDPVVSALRAVNPGEAICWLADQLRTSGRSRDDAIQQAKVVFALTRDHRADHLLDQMRRLAYVRSRSPGCVDDRSDLTPAGRVRPERTSDLAVGMSPHLAEQQVGDR